MNFFGKPREPKPQAVGEGAEQDRYEGHFGPLGEKAAERVQDLASKVGKASGGAEQDRLGSHFEMGADKAKAAAQGFANAKGTVVENTSNSWMGYDGKQRQKLMGAGAEQDRLGSHFALDRGTVDEAKHSIQNTFNQATGRK